jgi:hypothetical protein
MGYANLKWPQAEMLAGLNQNKGEAAGDSP